MRFHTERQSNHVSEDGKSKVKEKVNIIRLHESAITLAGHWTTNAISKAATTPTFLTDCYRKESYNSP